MLLLIGSKCLIRSHGIFITVSNPIFNYVKKTGEHEVGALITTMVPHHLLTGLKQGCMLSSQSSSHSGSCVQPISLQI